MTFESDQQLFGELEGKEARLRVKALKRATFEFRKAKQREGHLQGVATEAPEPTTAFRMVNKASLRQGAGAADQQNLFVYVPQGSTGEVFVDRFWTKFVLESGRTGMFSVNQDWAGVYNPQEQDEENIEDYAKKIGDESGEISAEAIVLGGIRHHHEAIRGLEAIIKAMRDDFVHVPYDY